MKCLEFERIGIVHGNHIVRRVRFHERSLLPVSAVCLVANGMREMLAKLFQSDVDVRTFEPVIPTERAWIALVQDAFSCTFRGAAGEATLLVRPPDVRALVAAVFGEVPRTHDTLSTIEREVLTRLVHRIGNSLVSFCGSSLEIVSSSTRFHGESAVYTTYVEIAIERPVTAALGVALARDPSAESGGAIALDDLHNVAIPLRVQLQSQSLCAARVHALQPGDILPLDDALPSVLMLGDRRIALGRSGAHERNFAFHCDEVAA